VGHPDIEIVDYKPLSIVGGPIRVTYRTRGSTQLKRVAKGMVGHVANMWTRNHTNATEDQLEADVEELVHLGVSASALAYEELEGDDPEADGNGFELIGIVGFSQALRENAEQAVGEVLTTGVQMKLVTWSQLAISKAIGRRVGLGDRMFSARVLKDDIFQGMPLDTLVLEAAGFAR
jgi:H+-transporting ATPase